MVVPGSEGAGPVLVIESSTYRGSVAVIRGSSILAEREVAMRGATEERLMPAVADALAAARVEPSRLEAVVCGAGPGSFTSLRIGAAIAKGMALANGIPLHSVSSLLLLVTGSAVPFPSGRYLAVADAMRGEWFAAEVRIGGGGEAGLTGVPSRIARERVEELAVERGLRLVGPGEGDGDWPHARGVAPILGHVLASEPESLEEWEPGYGRLAEAQVRWETDHGRALPTG